MLMDPVDGPILASLLGIYFTIHIFLNASLALNI